MTAAVLSVRGPLIVTAAVLVLAASACSDSPTSPDPLPSATTPPATTTPTPTPTPTTPAPTGNLTVQINPNPVPHSGVPITDAAGCANVAHTWYYDQVLSETGGSAVTITSRIDLFDDRETNNISNLNIVVPANGSHSVRTRWCSSNRAAHSAQTRWTGTDASGRAVTVLGPRVMLSAP